jgi:hypothetical protein
LALLSGLAIFAALQLTAAVLLELRFPDWTDPDYGIRLRGIRQSQAAGPAHRTVVVLGSSRAYQGLDNEALSRLLPDALGTPVSVVNCALPGAGPMTELLLWRRLLRDGVRPDLLVVEVLAPRLFAGCTLAELSEVSLPVDRIRWSDLALIERYRAGTRPGLWWQVLCAEVLPLYYHRAGILNALGPPWLAGPDRGPGYPPWGLGPFLVRSRPPPPMRAEALAWARREYRDMLAHLDPAGSGGRALCELLACCRRAHVPAALVLMPEGPTFRSWYPPGTWPKVESWLRGVSREFGTALVNARDWIGEEEFVDSHHLVWQGAEKFTARLGRENLLPLLRP